MRTGFLLCAVTLAAFVPGAADPSEGEEPGLAALMGRMQVYLHKLDLSVSAGNAELAGFYIHELEEATEEVVEHIPEYDGHPVSQLTEQMMMPAVERLEDALKVGDATPELDALIGSCNTCHAATEHGYIKVTRATSNPFNQDFGKD